MSDMTNRIQHRILIVDDETHILQVLSLKLRNAGYEVQTAMDGEEALELVNNNPPHLIITDYQMPILTGLELCQKLAAQEETALIPILMLTARGYSLSDNDLEIGNIKHVVHKPFSPRAILAMVEAMLAKSASSRTDIIADKAA
ncbi:MAG: response regulator [Planctomycetota bacterium]|nr:response regulator [Planctomycetota bacterium]